MDRLGGVDVVVLGYVDLRDSARTEAKDCGEVVQLANGRKRSTPTLNAKSGCDASAL